VNAAVAGKPIELAGSECHEDAVAQGLRVVLRLALEHFGPKGQSASVIVQGAGTVGGALARILHADGMKVVGLSDVHGGLYSPKGLDVPSLLAWASEHGSLKGCKGDFERIENPEMLLRPCD